MQSSKLTEIIKKVAPRLAELSAEQDAQNRFVEPAYALLKEHRFFAAAVPEALGGLGAGHAEVCDALRELAHACPSTALAASMHTHLVAATVWKHRRGQGGEPLLKRVAAEQIVLVSTGAGDWFESNGKLERVEGGYVLNAKKRFCSASPAGGLLVTTSVLENLEDPQNLAEGTQVLHFAVPFSAKGLRVDNDWDALGMRGTGSQTVHLEGVFVPEESIVLRRPRRGLHPAWMVVLTIAPPIYMSPYMGIAEEARDRAVALVRNAPRQESALLVGEMENSLMSARLAWQHMIANAAEYDFAPAVERVNAALSAKTLFTNAALQTVQKAMEAVGGAAYFRRTGIERLLRDVNGAPNHPLPEKAQQAMTGRLALGMDPLGT
jgi:alkylation response protein AidB-like acyl-CoA dehydrogenase